MHPGVELVALAGLDEEELGLPGEGGAALGVEVGPEPVGLVGVVGGVEDAVLAVGEDGHEEAVGVVVVLVGAVLQEAVDVLHRVQGWN